mmetsp:Transcript_63419/g.113172  ORF Transcript_63419/g.113172 Transcript_63419/m.113172 type:complete len:268 (+) Transcript_63419:791-1594(+)
MHRVTIPAGFGPSVLDHVPPSLDRRICTRWLRHHLDVDCSGWCPCGDHVWVHVVWHAGCPYRAELEVLLRDPSLPPYTRHPGLCLPARRVRQPPLRAGRAGPQLPGPAVPPRQCLHPNLAAAEGGAPAPPLCPECPLPVRFVLCCGRPAALGHTLCARPPTQSAPEHDHHRLYPRLMLSTSPGAADRGLVHGPHVWWLSVWYAQDSPGGSVLRGRGHGGRLPGDHHHQLLVFLLADLDCPILRGRVCPLLHRHFTVQCPSRTPTCCK